MPGLRPIEVSKTAVCYVRKIGEGYKVMSGLAHLFFCSSSRLLLDGIANDYFAIKMPGSVTENRHNDGEAHEERQRANQ